MCPDRNMLPRMKAPNATYRGLVYAVAVGNRLQRSRGLANGVYVVNGELDHAMRLAARARPMRVLVAHVLCVSRPLEIICPVVPHITVREVPALVPRRWPLTHECLQDELVHKPLTLRARLAELNATVALPIWPKRHQSRLGRTLAPAIPRAHSPRIAHLVQGPTIDLLPRFHGMHPSTDACQHNAVSIAKRPKSRIVAVRWPEVP